MLDLFDRIDSLLEKAFPYVFSLVVLFFLLQIIRVVI